MHRTNEEQVAIAGHRGLIGSAVAGALGGHPIMRINREDFTLDEEAFARKFDRATLLLNFTGSPIIQRWTRNNRDKIVQSRLGTTEKMGLISRLGVQRNRMLINASAIGIYSDTGIHTEESRDFNRGFLYQITSDWEHHAVKFENPETTVAVLRIGVVLSETGGMLKRLLPIFRAGLGGKIGDGKQAFSWIHLEDLVRAVKHIIHNRASGIYNLTAPGWVDNATFTRKLANQFNRPALAKVPRWALHLRFGDAAETVYKGQAVVPQRLINEGFDFRYPELDAALKSIVE